MEENITIFVSKRFGSTDEILLCLVKVSEQLGIMGEISSSKVLMKVAYLPLPLTDRDTVQMLKLLKIPPAAEKQGDISAIVTRGDF